MFFDFEKGLNGQMHLSSDPLHLMKNSLLVKFSIPLPLLMFSPHPISRVFLAYH